MRSLHVVAALIRRGSRVLLDRRPSGTRHAGLWEFPGGKREKGESDQQALRRELMEELGVDARIGSEVGRTEHAGEGLVITLVLYQAEIEGEPFAKEVEAIEWFAADQLEALATPPADRPLIRAVRALLTEEETPPVSRR